ncbi:hypothetical protein K6U06_13770 [Acidiferrimicrobium sp. IK]|uniref:hypothetical protein n=1 Tax=Acidiferrimicrobium sp. IK TaxID=2871700 RepID=UPI0021CB617E|nr:hypothetical protein [Acidiferrimicrobium sp. IK]MCU4185436.1 hypothetical protein [Acidiferrimicrobium sp. IK]
MSAATRRFEQGGTGSWLVRNDDVLAALGAPPAGRVVQAPPAPAVVLGHSALLHSTRSAGGMDVAWCRPAEAGGVTGQAVDPDEAGEVEVRRIRTLRAGWPMLVRPGAGVVVLAEAGAFDRWGLRVGDRLALRGR